MSHRDSSSISIDQSSGSFVQFDYSKNGNFQSAFSSLLGVLRSSFADHFIEYQGQPVTTFTLSGSTPTGSISASAAAASLSSSSSSATTATPYKAVDAEDQADYDEYEKYFQSLSVLGKKNMKLYVPSVSAITSKGKRRMYYVEKMKRDVLNVMWNYIKVEDQHFYKKEYEVDQDPFELWKKIYDLFHQQDLTSITELKEKMSKIDYKKCQNVVEYISRRHEMANQIRSIHPASYLHTTEITDIIDDLQQYDEFDLAIDKYTMMNNYTTVSMDVMKTDFEKAEKRWKKKNNKSEADERNTGISAVTSESNTAAVNLSSSNSTITENVSTNSNSNLETLSLMQGLAYFINRGRGRGRGGRGGRGNLYGYRGRGNGRGRGRGRGGYNNFQGETDNNNNTSEGVPFNQHDYEKGLCFKCHQPGHQQYNCQNYTGFTLDSVNNVTGSIIPNANGKITLMDSGTSNHVFGDSSLIHGLDSCDRPLTITSATGSQLNMNAKGHAQLYNVSNSTKKVILNNVYYHSDVPVNLISTAQLVKVR